MRRSISLEVGRTKGPSIASELSNQSNTRLILAASYSDLSTVICEFVVGRVDVKETICGFGIASR